MSEQKVFRPEVIAFYLPQYHEIPENNRWWGEGFTEWTNVKKARPLFDGHEQPVEPGELGYYNLLDPEIRIRQATLAKEHGITVFCYWHYWFGNGRRLLEKPFQQVLESGEPDFPFCLGWANESWTGIWHGSPDKVLMEQTYPGKQDIINHFEYLLPAFLDDRYLKVDGKPFFLVYRPYNHSDLNMFVDTFSELAIEAGFKGIHFVATNVREDWDLDSAGFAAVAPSYHNGILWRRKKTWTDRLKKKFSSANPMRIFTYEEASQYFLPGKVRKGKIYPVVVPNWDNSPRLGERGVIFTGSSPEKYRLHLEQALRYARENGGEHPVVMIKSWNEWAEGNYLEPDKKWGRAFLEVTREVLEKYTEL